MAEVTSLGIPTAETPRYVGQVPTAIVWSGTLTSGIAASADTIRIATLPASAQILFATLRVDASAGTGATLTLRQNTSALTAATTAGGADQEVLASVVGPQTSATIVDLLVGTSAVTASCNVRVNLGYVI